MTQCLDSGNGPAVVMAIQQPPLQPSVQHLSLLDLLLQQVPIASMMSQPAPVTHPAMMSQPAYNQPAPVTVIMSLPAHHQPAPVTVIMSLPAHHQPAPVTHHAMMSQPAPVQHRIGRGMHFPTLTPFDPITMNLRDWLQKFEVTCRLNGLSDTNKLEGILLYFSDSVHAWYNTLHATETDTWPNF